jgi:hypothetical protein
MKGYTYKNFKSFYHYITFSLIENRDGKHSQNMHNVLTVNDIENDVDFVVRNIDYFISFLPDKNKSFLKEKTLLEIGPGKNFGISLTLADLGLKNVVLLDPFLIPWDNQYHPEFYKMLLFELEKKFDKVDFDSLKKVIKCNAHQTEKLICYKKGLEDCKEIHDDSIDISFSNAVFEHFDYPKKAVQELNRITKKGGIGFHQIDLRDHRNFDQPLEFLTYPKWMFKQIIKITKAHSGNRLRYSEYNAIFEKYGFSVAFKADSYADAIYVEDVLSRSSNHYTKMKREEVAALSGRFFIEKTR